MLERRQLNSGLLWSLSLAGLPIFHASAWAQAPRKDDPLPKLLDGVEGPDARIRKYAEALTGLPLPEFGLLPPQTKGTAPLGKSRPAPQEKTLGLNIISGAPIACRPIDVAEYFRPANLVSKFGEAAGEYARGWPADRPFNPVLFEFLARMLYVDTDMIDKGDKTDWCAAFVSWCLLRSRVLSRTEKLPEALVRKYRHPGARAFLCFGQEAKQPKLGDIVVWYDHSSSYSCQNPNMAIPVSGAGHVAFYLGPSTALVKGKEVEAVSVLGGNQGFEGLENNQWICVKSVPKEYNGKKLAAFRTNPILHTPPLQACTKAMKDKREC